MLRKFEGRRCGQHRTIWLGGIINLINGQEFEQTPGEGEGQESLACYSKWGRKKSDMTE